MTENRARFALVGAAGYVAPRHLEAMRSIGGTLVAACDPHDSVGVLDRYFFEARFFREFERFDRHLDKVRRSGAGVEYLSICSPNYLHDAHIRFALRSGADVICEKPLVINPWNIAPLEALAEETGRRIWPVLQLREHPTWRELHQRISKDRGRKYKVELSTITSRGSWYANSWKGQEDRSGGLASNIGVHFFDALLWIFGPLEKSIVHFRSDTTLSGTLHLEGAEVRWFLSIDRHKLPAGATASGQTTVRSISVDGTRVEFSDGFTSLHSEVYRKIVQGESWTTQDARPSIELSKLIRDSEVHEGGTDRHPLLVGDFKR